MEARDPGRRIRLRRLAVTAGLTGLGLLAGAAVPGVPAGFVGSTGNGGNVFAAGSWSATSPLMSTGLAGRGQGGVTDVAADWTSQPASQLGGAAYTWIGAGADHTCGRKAGDGKLYCWGRNDSGQLGNDQAGGTSSYSLTPVPVADPADGTWVGPWASLSVGTDTSCATDSAAQAHLYCWGAGTAGQAGGSSTTNALKPVLVTAGTASGAAGYSTVSIGFENGCALQNGTDLVCWGSQNTGIGDYNPGSGGQPHPSVVTTGTAYSRLSMGRSDVCAIRTSDSHLLCWGLNRYGELGDRGIVLKSSPFEVSTTQTWSSVAVGADHICAITTGGTLWCAGSPADGQLGTGSSPPTLPPAVFRQVGSKTTWTAVYAGGSSTCAVESTVLWCWGANEAGQFGTGDADDVLAPVAVGGAGEWSAVSLGPDRLCTVATSDGRVWCAGSNAYGGLGRGTREAAVSFAAATITSVSGPWASVDAGRTSACAVTSGGLLYCWGANSSGQLGLGDTTGRSRPTRVGSGATWGSVSVGGGHACAVTTGQDLYCWGQNSDGQLGLGDTALRKGPVQVGAGTSWQAVSAGFAHTCAVTTGGQLWCWGDNAAGQLGLGDTADRNVPVQVGTATTWTSVSAGGMHTCALHGSLWCWGRNDWTQLGTGDNSSRSSPAQVGSGTTWTAVAAGLVHTCALSSAQALSCWGGNWHGQVGDGSSNVSTSTPTSVLTSVQSMAVGDEHTCAVLTSKAVRCWGEDARGQLGKTYPWTVDDVTWYLTPTAVASPASVLGIAAGGDVTLFLTP